MADDQTRSYRKLIDFVKEEVQNGRLHPGDRLKTERELAVTLGISRNSVREGMRLLENMGILVSRQGSGNYLSANFDETMSEMLSFMYFIKGMDEKQVTEFRWSLEDAALPLAIERITLEEKEELRETLLSLLEAQSEEEQIYFDKKLHHTIMHACRNDFIIASYEALTGLMDTYIQSMRSLIIEKMKSRHELETAHADLVLGVVDSDLSRARQGLESHFGFIHLYRT